MIFTIGHSTRTLAQLIGLLRRHDVTVLADVRLHPGSRRLPHFSRSALEAELPQLGIRYIHMPALGGRRNARPDSENTGWRNPQFRGYADHMASGEWRDGMQRLIELGEQSAVGAMCAEAVPWRCHRILIADALTAKGIEVRHILGDDAPQPHKLTAFARVEGGAVTYPPPDTLPLDG